MRFVVLLILSLLVLLRLIHTSAASALAPSPPTIRLPTQACLAENAKEAIFLYIQATEKALTSRIDGPVRHMVGLVQTNMFLAIRMYSTHYDDILYPASRGDGVRFWNAVEYSIDAVTGVVMIRRTAGNIRVPNYRRRVTAVSRFVANVDLRFDRLERQVVELPGIQEDKADMESELDNLRNSPQVSRSYFRAVWEHIHPYVEIPADAAEWEGRAKQIADKLGGHSRKYEEMRAKQRKTEQEKSVLWMLWWPVIDGVR